MARKHLSHIKSKMTENGGPKLPTSSQLVEGELAINFAKGYETLSILNSESGITTFTNDVTMMAYIDEQDLEIVNAAGLSAVTDSRVSGITNYQYVAPSDDEILSAATSLANADRLLSQTILDNEETVAEALNYLNDNKMDKTDALTAGDGINIENGEISTNGGIIYLDGYESPANNLQHDPVNSGNTVDEAFANIVSAMTDNELNMLETLSAMNESISGVSTALNSKANADEVYTIDQVDGLLAGKQNLLTAGENIVISGNVISSPVDYELDSGSTNPVANSAITTIILENERVVASALTRLNDVKLDSSAYTPYDDTQVRYLIALKQDRLTAGEGIDITNNVISSTIKVTEFVSNLPIEGVPGTIYFVPDPNSGDQQNNAFIEYAWNSTDRTWEIIGKWMPDITIDTELDSGSTNPVANSAITQAIIDDERIIALALNDIDNKKLDASAYTVDLQMSTSSKNPVANSAITTALGDKLDATAYTPITVDATMSTGSSNPVANSAITTAINAKQDTISGGSGISVSNSVVSISPFIVNVTNYGMSDSVISLTTNKTYQEAKSQIEAGVPVVVTASNLGNFGPLQLAPNGNLFLEFYNTFVDGTYEYGDLEWNSGDTNTIKLYIRSFQQKIVSDGDGIIVTYGPESGSTTISVGDIDCGEYLVETT